jgi:AcrR family transcriptional regulator
LNGFERRTERKKAAVRQAALELFRDHGVRRVTVGEIARRAAVSPVTIYNHFGSKEDLVRDAVKHFLSAMMEKYQAIILSDRPFLEKLESIVFDKTQIAATSNEEFMQTLVSNDPEIREFIDTMFQSSGRASSRIPICSRLRSRTRS